jgi:hypothetical protein
MARRRGHNRVSHRSCGRGCSRFSTLRLRIELRHRAVSHEIMLDRQKKTHIRMGVRIYVVLGRIVAVALNGVPTGLSRPALRHERHEGALSLQAMGCTWVISPVRGASIRCSVTCPAPQRAPEAAMRMCVAAARHC